MIVVRKSSALTVTAPLGFYVCRSLRCRAEAGTNWSTQCRNCGCGATQDLNKQWDDGGWVASRPRRQGGLGWGWAGYVPRQPTQGRPTAHSAAVGEGDAAEGTLRPRSPPTTSVVVGQTRQTSVISPVCSPPLCILAAIRGDPCQIPSDRHTWHCPPAPAPARPRPRQPLFILRRPLCHVCFCFLGYLLLSLNIFQP